MKDTCWQDKRGPPGGKSRGAINVPVVYLCVRVCLCASMFPYTCVYMNIYSHSHTLTHTQRHMQNTCSNFAPKNQYVQMRYSHFYGAGHTARSNIILLVLPRLRAMYPSQNNRTDYWGWTQLECHESWTKV